MPPPDRRAIAAELIRRGVSPDTIAQAGFPEVAQQGRSGFIGQRPVAPDATAARQVWVDQSKKINDQQERVAAQYPTQAELDRFMALNRRQRTGGIQHQEYDGWEKMNPMNWPGMAGNVVAKYDPEVREMAGIASRLQGEARPQGSGATSDFEQRLYRAGVPSPEKTGTTNQNIVRRRQAIMQEEQDRLAFTEAFLKQNGTTNGAANAWGQYVSRNPYTTETTKGQVVMNPKRQDWAVYMGLAPAPRAQPARGAPTSRDQQNQALKARSAGAWKLMD